MLLVPPFLFSPLTFPLGCCLAGPCWRGMCPVQHSFLSRLHCSVSSHGLRVEFRGKQEDLAVRARLVRYWVMMHLTLFLSARTAWGGGIISEALGEANWQPGWFLMSTTFLRKQYKMLSFYNFASHLAECFLTSLCLYNPRNHLKRDPSLRVKLAQEIQVTALWNGLWAVNIRAFVCLLSALPVTNRPTRTTSAVH